MNICDYYYSQVRGMLFIVIDLKKFCGILNCSFLITLPWCWSFHFLGFPVFSKVSNPKTVLVSQVDHTNKVRYLHRSKMICWEQFLSSTNKKTLWFRESLFYTTEIQFYLDPFQLMTSWFIPAIAKGIDIAIKQTLIPIFQSIALVWHCWSQSK